MKRHFLAFEIHSPTRTNKETKNPYKTGLQSSEEKIGKIRKSLPLVSFLKDPLYYYYCPTTIGAASASSITPKHPCVWPKKKYNKL